MGNPVHCSAVQDATIGNTIADCVAHGHTLTGNDDVSNALIQLNA